ncbi:gliding motility-associated C-terminal domain-containing protein [Chitinophaga sp. 22321]|uniref:Gliding motility-associated C-terminal domain-containing protein n=1 Tax=Chitinophaga hostae TaxID=2831022 RepID=A0ABS5J4W7_9BACT|nr:right-handed parallel beta-helix repeat-containing protein [Chitinophaga hostae]MBS0030263.1 gliding motility-associated C-terminal domain-containing protein [Chitinophaga hostae]
MRNCTVRYLYKTTLLIGVLLMLVARLSAQTDISIGNSTSGNTDLGYPCPMQDYYEGSRAQFLYRAAELHKAGMAPGVISGLKFNVLNLNATDTIEQYTIKIGVTSDTTLSGTSWITVSNQVYGPVDYLPKTGINILTFASNFFWNGTDNIVVEICNGAPDSDARTTYTHNPEIPFTTGLSFNGSHTYRTDGLNYLCGTTSTSNTGSMTTRPDIKFSWTPAVACTGTPTAGTATASPATVCMNGQVTVTLSGTTIASGIHYQWQSSSNNTTWTDIPNDTTNRLETKQAATTYYRCRVTCVASNATATSNSVAVNSPLAISGTFTINKALPTGGTNFASFNDAYNWIKCGINGPVIFNVAAGSSAYNEQLLISPVPGASATNTITFNGNGDTLTYGGTAASPAVIKLSDADYFTFNNLVIKPTGTNNGWGVHLTNDADYNAIRNCTFLLDTTSSSSSNAGIVISNSTSATSTGEAKCDFNTFADNNINGGYYGVVLTGSNTFANGNNKIINNKISNFYSYGIYVTGSFNTLIENNTISRATRSNVTSFYGIYFTDLSTKANITRNIIRNPFGGAPNSTSTAYGIYFSSTDALSQLENVVSNNLLHNFTGKGDVYGIYNSGSDNVWYYHNTIALDGASTTSATYTTRGFYQTSKADGVEFVNNLISVTRTGGGNKYCIYFGATNGTIHANRNDYYLAASGGTNNTGYYGANNASLLDWQTASKQDSNSVSSNPLFVSAGSGNYKPANASIDNKGTPVNITVDINNAVRSTSTPDIGAYEFTPGPCVTPPLGGNAQVSPSVICVNRKVALTLTDNSIGLGQTYQWQRAAAAGPYTPVGSVLSNPDTVITAVITSWYRVAVTCSGNTAYSQPILLTVNQAFPAGTYTINKNVPASATNFISFNAAKAAMECGIQGPIVINVTPASGPYLEQLVLDSIAGTSAVNTITFNGNGNTIKFAPADDNERAVIKLRGADHITFDSLTIDATGGDYGYGVQLLNNADSNKVTRCNILTDATATYNEYAGIVVNGSETSPTSGTNNGCDGNIFSKNKITGGYYGITIYAETAAPATRNSISNNTITEFYETGISLSYATNTLVDHNDISRPGRNSDSYSIYGIGVENKAADIVVSNNRIHNMLGGAPASTSTVYGIEFSYADATSSNPAKVFNNLVYDISGDGTQYGFSNYSADYIYYYHNTIVLNNGNNPSSNNSTGFYQSGTATGIQFYDNILDVSRSGQGNRTGLSISNGTVMTSNYNDIFVKSDFNTAYTGETGADYATLAAWTAGTKLDSNSLAVPPVFADPVAGNYAPVISPLDNTGKAVGITTDILGANRSATRPDMGAYEVSIPNCSKPVVPGTSSVFPLTPVCMGTSIKLDLTGNSTGGTQTYQWQRSVAASGPWVNASDTLYVSVFNTTIGIENYYRCRIVCGGTDTAYSTTVKANLNPPLLAGVYTINPALPTSTTNFQSFSSAVSKLECGIAGPVTFLAKTGTYTEQITMHHIPGASAVNRVTFSSETYNAAAVTLTYTGTSALNYVLKLDSVDYVTWKAITIKPAGTANARGVVYTNTSSYDSIAACIIPLPATTSTSTAVSGIYGDECTGTGNVISGNTITNGANGIYWSASYSYITPGLVLDSNKLDQSYVNGVYVEYTDSLIIQRNQVNMSGNLASDAYGIHTDNTNGYIISGNKISMSNTADDIHGIYLNSAEANAGIKGLVTGNRITARGNITGDVRGLEVYQTEAATISNNVISLKSSGTNAYGIYSESSSNLNYYNNSVLSSAVTTGDNYAAYFRHTSTYYGNVKIKNNIFASDTSGVAMYVANPLYLKSDYNTLYTKGTILVKQATPAGAYATLHDYISADTLDINSIVYKPAFVNDTTLQPAIANPEVWAIHGRGVQIEGNDKDINGAARPVKLTDGVPDMGAYEFLPTAVPPVLPAFPAAAAPGVTQTFMFGTDTVTKITWNPGTAIPTNIAVRRYSGIKPPNLANGTAHMYFYTDVDVTPANGQYNFNIDQFYLDPWQGFIKRQKDIRMGRTDNTNTWIVDSLSHVYDIPNVIRDSSLHFLDKFTGLNGGVTNTQLLQPADSSNRGTRFWVGYGHHQFFTGDNSQNMVLYLNAQDSANVTVRINGTSWERVYHIPSNKTITTEIIPKNGLNDARLIEEGLSDKGISIESDVPIVAYAHIYGSASSGATMLLPVGTYGYEYATMSSRQNYGTDTYSWFYVIADYDNTKVEITPSVPTLAGKPANTTFTVTLNKGEVYQVLGAMMPGGGSEGYDLTGSRVRSVINEDGKCYPMAVFSGSSRTGIGCGGAAGGSGDNLIQQNFPSQAWGKKYLTAPTSNSSGAASFMTNIYRVLVKDPATAVKVNGTALTGLINNRFYQFESNTASNIEANQPIMVAQYMSSSGSCANTNGNGDPEMIYLSPVEQGIKKVGLYRNTQEAITVNYLTLIIPTGGISSLLIDGSATFDHTYPHPNASGYTVVVKRWPAAPAQCTVTSDSAFTAITYGLGSVESYGYNAGTLVKNLNILPSFNNVMNNSGQNNTYTCAKTPFRFSMLIPVKPTSITWKFSQVASLAPKTDIVQNNPVPVDSMISNERKYYRFTVPADYVFSKPGLYDVPILISHPDIESCSNSFESILQIKVIPAPVVNFSVDYTGCLNDGALFKGTAATSNGVAISSWKWNFGDSTLGSAKDTLKYYRYPGVKQVKLSIVAAEGCVGDTTKEVEVYAPAIAQIVKDSMTVCSGTNVTLSAKNPEPGVLYNWYDAPAAGNLLHTGNDYTINNVSTDGIYYLETLTHGCPGAARAKAIVHVLPVLATPVVTVDSTGVNMIRFKWKAIANATGYEVSVDGGTTWTLPSSGREGLVHIIGGLQPVQTVKLIVRAKGCEDKESLPAEGKTLPDGIYIPNTFTPNNDGKNDVLLVYGYIIKQMHMTIFDQWGEKVFESNNQTTGWDGQYKGKALPSGVYIYVCHLTLTDGSKTEKKGVINLIR